MDYHALQQKLFALDPTDPREDLAKLKAQAGGNAPAPAPQVDYIAESASVPEGSLQMDRKYSVNDFAALAGITLNETQKTGPAGQAKGKDPMPAAQPGRTKHPLKDKLVGDSIAYEDQELDELGIRGAGPVSFAAIQTQLQDLMNNLKTLETEYRKQMQQAQQPQQRQNAFAGGSFALDDPDYAQRIAGESIDSIKDTLYAALNKKMGE